MIKETEEEKRQRQAQFSGAWAKHKEWCSRPEKFSDEDFFNEVLALPDSSFKLVAQNMRFTNEHEDEKGMRWSILPSELKRIQAETQRLEEMGLIYWYCHISNGEEWGQMTFNQKLLNERLGYRDDLIRELKDSAKSRGLSSFYL